MPPMIRTNITLDQDTIASIDLMATALGGSKSEIIRRAVQTFRVTMRPAIEAEIERRTALGLWKTEDKKADRNRSRTRRTR